MVLVDKKFFEERNKKRNYLHFDKKRSPSFVYEYVINPSNIVKHSFYPFIFYNLVDNKIKRVAKYYNNKLKFHPLSKPPLIIHHHLYPFISYKLTNKANIEGYKYVLNSPKVRGISYASHLDSDIYAYYSRLLETPYEKFLVDNNLEDCSLAYRKVERVIDGKLVSKCNIHFSKDVFDIIRTKKDCIVLCYDVENFFDRFDHQILKKNWCDLLQNTQLPPDHYKVYKSLTRFASVDKEELYKELGLSLNSKTLHKRYEVLCSSKDFRDRIRGKRLINVNKSGKGIPQGSPISGLLSNVHMIEFDKEVNSYLAQLGGKYFRYSDDMIFIIDKEQEQQAISFIKCAIQKIKLNINNKKTQRVEFKDGFINHDINNRSFNNPDKLQYLGLLFDGKQVFLRETGQTRYRRKLRKAVRMRTAHYRRLKEKDNLNSPNMYMRTLHTRFTYIGQRNYVSYAFRASRIHESKNIKRQVKGHYNLFNDYLNKKK